MTKEPSGSYTTRSALCDMFMGYRRSLSNKYNPTAIFTDQELALPVRISSVYSIRKPDMCRQITFSKYGTFQHERLQASDGRQLILSRASCGCLSFSTPRKAIKILRLIGLRQHFVPETPPIRTKFVICCITLLVNHGVLFVWERSSVLFKHVREKVF